MQVGKESLVVILRRFGDVIRGGGAMGLGVDVEAEARAERSRLVLRELAGLRAAVQRRLAAPNSAADAASLKDIAALLTAFQ